MAKTNDSDSMLSHIIDAINEIRISTHNIDKEVTLQKASAEERHVDIKQIQEDQRRLTEVMRENTDSLNEHMARTDLLEKAVMAIDSRLTPIEIERIQKTAIAQHRNDMLMRIAKIMGVLTAIGGIIMAAKPLILLLLT